MKIKKIQVKNFRLLKDFQIDLEEVLSLIVGKNNCGKTSFLNILEKFLALETNNFAFNDLNLKEQSEIFDALSKQNEVDVWHGVRLRIVIEYDENDNLENISSLILDLDPKVNEVVLCFEYSIDFERLELLKKEFNKYYLGFKKKRDKAKVFKKFMEKHHKQFFKIVQYAEDPSGELERVLIDDRKLVNKIINFMRIKAKRDVVGTDGSSNRQERTLSKASSRYYDKIPKTEIEDENSKKLQEQLAATDGKLTEIYADIFSPVIEKIKRFGGIKENESVVKFISSLEEKNLLKENTNVVYQHDEDVLPEDYNGLGYLNLISMVLEIEVIINDFKRKNLSLAKPSDLNLLFIEEPEAHTHPQLQYIFIKNIKELLREEYEGVNDGVSINLQTVISTHSSHIASESDFNDIKYFKSNNNSVDSRNLSDLEKLYGDNERESFQFLKQYLTLNKAELFFAEKAIFIEGDTERVLIPAMMKKIDLDCKDKELLPLLSQNISIVEVGAYSQVFDVFLRFVDVKVLIITDLDSVKKVPRKKDGEIAKNKNGEFVFDRISCPVSEGESSSNSSINYYLGTSDLQKLIKTKPEQKCRGFCKENILDPKKPNWVADEKGSLRVAFQNEDGGYHARSFEDAFFSKNLTFIKAHKGKFKSLKNKKILDEGDFYRMGEMCIAKKSHFATDILFFSDQKFSNWEIPSYILEGLLWLKK